MALEPANLGRIAAFYYIKYQTIELFSKNLEEEATGGKKMKFLLEILAKSAEFESIPIRQGEASLLQSLVPYLTYPLEAPEGGEVVYNRPEAKTNMLLQCHFNRTALGPDLRIDQKYILE
jgi:pre-mRNA-splicing helicase BRR2